MIALVDEMAATLLRTSFSTVIGAANDFGCELLDAQGNGLAHATRSMPVFNLLMPKVCKAIIQKYGDTICQGDIFICNDPWLLVGHTPDIAIVLPFFKNGVRVGFAASIAHMADIGGILDQNRARESYEEGLLIPLTRLYDKSHEVTVVLDFIYHNVRNPEMVIGDVHAQVSAAHVGAQKALSLLDEYHLSGFSTLAHDIHTRSEIAIRAAIRALPDGDYGAEMCFDELDGPLTAKVLVRVRGDALSVDFAGSAPQHPHGGINSTLSYTTAHTCYALKCALLPDVPSNEGCYAPFQVSAPAGSIFNCTRPASTMNRTKSGWYIAPLIMQALCQALPNQVFAAGGLMGAIGVYGYEPNGRRFNASMFNAGGLGATAYNDGLHTTVFPSSASNVPVELFEIAVPVLITEKELIAGSGGAGKFRGGLGQRTSIRRLPGSLAHIIASASPHRQSPAPEGLHGALAGLPAQVRLNGKWLSRLEATQLTGAYELREGDELTVDTAGGGGFGDPAERAFTAIQKDIQDGVV
jgi:N-methylhydantoinase B/oxoprolinase/acetone carboxylase alpha subunit